MTIIILHNQNVKGDIKGIWNETNSVLNSNKANSAQIKKIKSKW